MLHNPDQVRTMTGCKSENQTLVNTWAVAIEGSWAALPAGMKIRTTKSFWLVTDDIAIKKHSTYDAEAPFRRENGLCTPTVESIGEGQATPSNVPIRYVFASPQNMNAAPADGDSEEEELVSPL